MTVPSYVDKGTLVADNATSIAVGFPATVAEGEIAILVALSTTSITMPGSFTAETEESGVLKGRLAWKRCTGSEGGTTVNVTKATGANLWAQIYTFSGCVDTGTPYEGYDVSTSGTITTPAVVSTVDETLGAVFSMLRNVSTTFTAAAGYTERVDNSASVGGMFGSATVNTIDKTSAGTTAAGTITAAGGVGDGHITFGLALKPLVTAGYPKIIAVM